GGLGRVSTAHERPAGDAGGLDRDGAQASTDRLPGTQARHDVRASESGAVRGRDEGEADQGVEAEGTPVGAGGHREDGECSNASRSPGRGIKERKRVSEPIRQSRRRPTEKNTDEYPFRKPSGYGRRACAPRRTRNGDDLGVLNGPAAERFLATVVVPSQQCLSCSKSADEAECARKCEGAFPWRREEGIM